MKFLNYNKHFTVYLQPVLVSYNTQFVCMWECVCVFRVEVGVFVGAHKFTCINFANKFEISNTYKHLMVYLQPA